MWSPIGIVGAPVEGGGIENQTHNNCSFEQSANKTIKKTEKEKKEYINCWVKAQDSTSMHGARARARVVYVCVCVCACVRMTLSLCEREYVFASALTCACV